jgi:hypothetical protein
LRTADRTVESAAEERREAGAVSLAVQRAASNHPDREMIMLKSRFARPVLPAPAAGLLAVVLFSLPASPAQDKPPDARAAAYDDYRNMLDQLGITRMRPGRDGRGRDTSNEATANPFKDSMPDLMTFKDGTRVKTADQWPKRRAEIVEDFEREVYGRVPRNVPRVTWEVTRTAAGQSGGVPTVTKTLVGHVDNSAFPQVKVDIQASFTVPKAAAGKVPIMLEFSFGFGFGGGFGGFARVAQPGIVLSQQAQERLRLTDEQKKQLAGLQKEVDFRLSKILTEGQIKQLKGMRQGGGFGGGFGAGANSWTQQALKMGWGYGTINPSSIQPDNSQLRQGIIGLTNKGRPRTPEDWGALRAWAWGVSRLIDYFEANPGSGVDPAKVCVTGVSRYGKAALVATAFDTRIAAGFVASSGAGGGKLFRRDFGELLENLASRGGYHWMAGNFLKYAADEGRSGKRTAADLPVDQHELIALCAPRLCFISYGVPERGDPNWVDAHGSFMAAVLAGPAYRLLGKRNLGTPGDYLTDRMPAVNTLIGGELAWRQHDGGHTNVPNFPAFYAWAGRYIATAGPATKK